MSKIKICLDDPKTRAIWEAALKTRDEVASWPAWKRGETAITKVTEEAAAAAAARADARLLYQASIETRAELAARDEAPTSAWRPIETAPQDGSSIIGLYADTTPFQLVVLGWLPFPGASDRLRWRDAEGNVWCTPSHWMPFPEVPR